MFSLPIFKLSVVEGEEEGCMIWREALLVLLFYDRGITRE